MPKFVTIGYGDQAGYDRTPPNVRDAAHAHDADLRRKGVLMGTAGTPVQVRNPEATGVQTTSGPFMTSSLPVAGFAIIEAADLSEAIDIVSRVPCSVAHGISIASDMQAAAVAGPRKRTILPGGAAARSDH